MIGDPSGKSAERNLLSKEQLAANVAGMAAQMRRFLDFDAGERVGAAASTTSTGRRRGATSSSCATSARTFPST